MNQCVKSVFEIDEIKFTLLFRNNDLMALRVALFERDCKHVASLGGSVGCTVRLETRRSWVQPPRGRQHSFAEIDHEIFSTVLLSLPLIQEGQLSVSGERLCTILVNRLED